MNKFVFLAVSIGLVMSACAPSTKPASTTTTATPTTPATPTSTTPAPAASSSSSVTPALNATGLVYGFETGLQGWAIDDFEPSGAVELSTLHATEGKNSIHFTPTKWDAFGLKGNGALDFTGYSRVIFDVFVVGDTEAKFKFATHDSAWKYLETPELTLNKGLNPNVEIRLVNLFGSNIGKANSMLIATDREVFVDNVRFK